MNSFIRTENVKLYRKVLEECSDTERRRIVLLLLERLQEVPEAEVVHSERSNKEN